MTRSKRERERFPALKALSDKQLIVMCWWSEGSAFRFLNGIICDGAVRSGKTSVMSISFALWAMSRFRNADFAICGKTILAARRNIVTALLAAMREEGVAVEECFSRNMFTLELNGAKNSFHLFGGRDESSAAHIQGMTLGGVLFDEVALMPEGFVNQAIARCSMSGAKLWFNCNPEGPRHWFYEKFILGANRRKLLHLHFTMDDNPSLSEEIKRKYREMYTGAFFERFIEGKWVAAEGLVYPEAARGKFTFPVPAGDADEYAVSVDYGTVNPFSAGLWGKWDGVWFRVDEFYFSSREEGRQMTDEEYYGELENLVGGRPVVNIIIDPSAASFISLVNEKGRFTPIKAENDVLNGIRKTQTALRSGRIRIDPRCVDALREFSLYRWDEKGEKDRVKKENDHAMDDIRYFVSTYLAEGDGFFALSAERSDSN